MNRFNFKTGPALILATLAMLTSTAQAHGDEDHSHPSAPAPQAATPAGLPAGNASAPQRLPDGSVNVPKATQRLFELRTVLAEQQALPSSVELKGQVMADPSAAGRVQASQAGLIEVGPRGLPHLGQAVRKGEVLAYLVPQGSTLEKAAAQAQLAELSGQLVVAEQKVRRQAQLEGSIPQKEIDAARAELDSLQQRKAALAAGLGARSALVAPIAGVLSNSNAVAGQVVDARDVLFEIVQPTRLLVQALAYDARLGTDIDSAAALTSAKQPLKLSFLGAGLELREQAVPLQFRILAPVPALSLGQPVTVLLATRTKVKGFAVPQAAVTQSAANESLVWVHTSAERFEARKVRVQPLDATRVVVTAGLQAGERVVVQGATLLAQIR
jgi:RND family efflux transporter MFP subunit